MSADETLISLDDIFCVFVVATKTMPAAGSCLWRCVIMRDCHFNSPVTLEDSICAIPTYHEW